MPRGYFDKTTVDELAALQEKTLARRREELLPELTVILANKRIDNTWQSSAEGIYRNWLRYICAQKVTVPVSKRLKGMADSEEFLGAPYPQAFLLGEVG
jgi:hypothetical protein